MFIHRRHLITILWSFGRQKAVRTQETVIQRRVLRGIDIINIVCIIVIMRIATIMAVFRTIRCKLIIHLSIES